MLDVSHFDFFGYSDEKWLSQILQNSINYCNKKDSKISIFAYQVAFFYYFDFFR